MTIISVISSLFNPPQTQGFPTPWQKAAYLQKK